MLKTQTWEDVFATLDLKLHLVVEDDELFHSFPPPPSQGNASASTDPPGLTGKMCLQVAATLVLGGVILAL